MGDAVCGFLFRLLRIRLNWLWGSVVQRTGNGRKCHYNQERRMISIHWPMNIMIEYPWTGISTSNLFSIDENGVPPTPALLHDKQLFILLLLVSLFRPEQTMIPPIRSIYILRMLWCVVDVVKMMQVAQGGSGWIKEILSLIKRNPCIVVVVSSHTHTDKTTTV